MMHNRRAILAGLGLLGLAPSLAHAQPNLDLAEFGLVPDLGSDQSAAMQAALDAAAQRGLTLALPAGIIHVRDLALPPAITITGIPGRSVLSAWQDGIIASANAADSLTITGVTFNGDATGAANGRGLLEIASSTAVSLDNCRFVAGQAMGLATTLSGIAITNCTFVGHADAAIHSLDSLGLMISGNRIADCGNGGIRIWRSEAGLDGSIITGNFIDKIDWRDGGNGANGNGINVFKADGVIISNNRIADCAFSAVRLNTTNNSQVSGNTCLRSGETAIYSEFAFSGSVIANNIVDGAATGISMTNYNEGGHIAVCTGNIVRNITPSSTVNPDASPVGIYAEADSAVTGNTIDHVPGAGIVAGYGPYLSNVLVANNVMHDILVGVAVSVAEGAGNAQVSNNMIFAPQHAVVGMAWADMVEPDLIANAGNYPQLTIANNTVGKARGA